MREKRTIQELQAEQDKEKFKRIREKAEVNKSRAQEANSDAPEQNSPHAIRVQDYVQQEQPSPARVINTYKESVSRFNNRKKSLSKRKRISTTSQNGHTLNK